MQRLLRVTFGRHFVLLLALFLVFTMNPAGVLAAQQATPEPPPLPSPTATTASLAADDTETQVASISGFTVHVDECTDSTRKGNTDFFFSGDITAAGKRAVDCQPIEQYIDGAQVHVQLFNDASAFYDVDIDASGNAVFPSGIQPGTYTVWIGAGEEYMATMPDQLVLEENGTYSLRIVRYVFIAGATGPVGLGTGSVSGIYYSCLDPSRAGTVDILINAVGAGDVGSNCQPYGDAQARLQLATTSDTGGDPYSASVLVSPGGTFTFAAVPYGYGYTITDTLTNTASSTFPVGGDVGANVSLTMYSYHAAEPALLGTVNATLVTCVDPDRNGDIEFVIDQPFSAAASCYYLHDYQYVPPFTFTLESNSDTRSQSVPGSDTLVTFAGMVPDTYTLNASVVPFDADSEPFELGNGQQVNIQVIHYVGGTPTGNPGVGPGSISGTVRYCTSANHDGDVDFVIDNSAVSGVESGTSNCIFAGADQGVLTLSYLGNDVTPATTPVQTFMTTTNVYGSYSIGTGFLGGTLPLGWYQLSFRDSNFSEQVYQSDTFALASSFPSPGTTVDILAYMPVPTGSAYFDVVKSTCFDPARDGEADFFINQFPAGEVDSAATWECTGGAYPAGTTLMFTLTDTATGDSVDSIIIVPFLIGSISYRFVGIPAGTYTLTETISDLSGSRQVVSDAFTIDPGAGSYEMEVKNYTGISLPDDAAASPLFFSLEAFTCLNPDRAGEFEYFERGFDLFGSGSTGSAAFTASVTGTSACQAATAADGFAFELESVPADSSEPVAYPLVQNPDAPWIYFSASGSPIPMGTYLIRETSRGLESDPVSIGGFGELIQFYFYQASPLEASNTSFTITAGQTYTGNLASLVSGGVPPYIFTLLSGPGQGTLDLQPDGSFTYTASDDASGSDSFQYTVTDSQGSTQVTAAAQTPGTVSITINPAAPTATATATATSPDSPTATSPDSPTVTPTATSPGDATATATMPSGVTPTSTASATTPGGGLPATQPAPGTSPTPGVNATSAVSALPATGQGTGMHTAWGTLWLLLAGFLLLAAAVLSRREWHRKH